MKGFAHLSLMRESAEFSVHEAFDEKNRFERVLIQIFEEPLRGNLVSQLAFLPLCNEIPPCRVIEGQNAIVYAYPSLGFYSEYTKMRESHEIFEPYLQRYLEDAFEALAEAAVANVSLCPNYDMVFMANIAPPGEQDVHLQFVLSGSEMSDEAIRIMLSKILLGGDSQAQCSTEEDFLLRLCSAYEWRYAAEFCDWILSNAFDSSTDCKLLLRTGVCRNMRCLDDLEQLIAVTE